MSDSTSDEIAQMQAARRASKASHQEIHPSLLESTHTDPQDGTKKKGKKSSRFDTSLAVTGGGDGDYEMTSEENEESGQGEKQTRLLDSCTFTLFFFSWEQW